MRLSGRIITVLILIVAVSGIITACGNVEEEKSRDVFAMDTYMKLTAYGPNANEALAKSEELIYDLENKLSVSRTDSEIYAVNKVNETLVSEQTAYIIRYAIQMHDMTDGSFNPLVYPLMRLWGFADKQYRVPDQQEIDFCLRHMDTDKVNIGQVNNDENMKDKAYIVKLQDKNMELDLGGIVKGYVSDRITELYADCGVKDGIINLGGNVFALGHKPDGSEWKVGIKNPAGDGYTGVLSVTDKAVITSGGYERYFVENDKVYHHIINPATGRPADSGLVSVTIVSDDGMLADSLSTALYIMGYEGAVQYWKDSKDSKDSFEMILITDSGEQYITSGICNDYQTDNVCEIIS